MAPTSSGFLVDIDGSPLAADAKALLISAYVDDSLRLPDTFVLRFRDPERIGDRQVRSEDRRPRSRSRCASDASDQPGAADRG